MSCEYIQRLQDGCNVRWFERCVKMSWTGSGLESAGDTAYGGTAQLALANTATPETDQRQLGEEETKTCCTKTYIYMLTHFLGSQCLCWHNLVSRGNTAAWQIARRFALATISQQQLCLQYH